MSILQSSFFTSNVIIREAMGTPAAPMPYFGFGTPATPTGVQSSGPRIYAGDGFPNGVLSAPLGSLWINSTSVAGSIWVNTNGATEWFALAMAYNTVLNVIADPGTGQPIPVDFSGTLDLTIGAGAETNTLADPTIIGQTLRINADTVGGGTRAITCASDIDIGGDNVMTFDAVRDSIELVAITVGTALKWQVAWNNNVALS